MDIKWIHRRNIRRKEFVLKFYFYGIIVNNLYLSSNDQVMADFSSFSSSLFHTSTWINAALKDHMNEEEPLDTYLAQLAIKLHIISQDYTDQLENGTLTFLY